MRRKVKVQLHRRQGKKLHSVTVTVLQVTLGGFIECLRAAGTKVQEFKFKLRRGGELTQRDVIMALAHADVCAAVADVLCPDKGRGWFRAWHSEKSILKMLKGAQATSDWSRLIAQLDFSGKGRQGRGSLYGDAITIARMLGVNPQEIIDVWPMERFLDICDGLLAATRAAKEAEMLEDPTMDSNAEPTPLTPRVIAGSGGKVYIN